MVERYIGHYGINFWLLNRIVKVLSVLTMRLFVENQVWAAVELFTFSCKVFKLLPIIIMFVSSAYKTVFACVLRGRSFIYNKNSSGPRIDPWGTPMSTSLVDEITLPRLRHFNSTNFLLNMIPSTYWLYLWCRKHSVCPIIFYGLIHHRPLRGPRRFPQDSFYHQWLIVHFL